MVIEVGDVIDLAAAPTAGQCAESFRAGKCNQLRRNFRRGLAGGGAGGIKRDQHRHHDNEGKNIRFQTGFPLGPTTHDHHPTENCRGRSAEVHNTSPDFTIMSQFHGGIISVRLDALHWYCGARKCVFLGEGIWRWQLPLPARFGDDVNSPRIRSSDTLLSAISFRSPAAYHGSFVFLGLIARQFSFG